VSGGNVNAQRIPEGLADFPRHELTELVGIFPDPGGTWRMSSLRARGDTSRQWLS
jgi:hypothetical protein